MQTSTSPSPDKDQYNTLNLISNIEFDNDDELKDINKPLEQQCYYHGVLPRTDIDKTLEYNGQFLVRKEVENGKERIIVSLKWNNCPMHFEPPKKGNVYETEYREFKTIPELIYHHYSTKEPLTDDSGATLLNPKKVAHWFLNNDQITCTKKIGKGQFGEVHVGTLDANAFKMQVAIKVCLSFDKDEQQKFIEEAKLMLKYDHPNIVRMLGVAATRDPIMLVLEYVEGGSLEHFLRYNTGLLSPKIKLKWCVLACRGMEYLERKELIHRDLAARNCLVTKRKHIKISDFGLSRSGNQYAVQSHQTPIPIRWTALEIFKDQTYSHKSDVWSFGILMWEIYSEGEEPYPDIENNKDVIPFLRLGKRMHPPRTIPPQIDNVMQDCWLDDPDKRPTFFRLKNLLESNYSHAYENPQGSQTRSSSTPPSRSTSLPKPLTPPAKPKSKSQSPATSKRSGSAPVRPTRRPSPTKPSWSTSINIFRKKQQEQPPKTTPQKSKNKDDKLKS